MIRVSPPRDRARAGFEHGGLAARADSWVGTPANLPLNASQLQRILGSGSIGQIAQQLGLSHGEAGAGLVQLAPQLINHLTPDGPVPANHSELLQQALSLLSRRSTAVSVAGLRGRT